MWQGSIGKQLKQAVPAYIILVVFIIGASIASSDFRNPVNLGNILVQSTALIIAALGQSIVLIIGGIDLSIGSVISFSTVLVATISMAIPGGAPIAVLACLGMGALVGVLNGIGCTRFNIPPMIITLSVGTLLKGVALFVMPSPGGKVSTDMMLFLTAEVEIFNVSSIIALVLCVVAFVVMHYTRTGRSMYAVGGNALHARQSGLNDVKLKILAYVMSGMLSAFAGLVLAMRIFSGDAVIGDPVSLDTVAAAVVGGLSLSGGIGTPLGALAGALILTLINNILNMLNIFSYYQYLIKGVILVAALLIFQLKRRKKI